MKTYRSKETGWFVGTKVEQASGEEYETVEIPTNPKEDLITFLNELVATKKVHGEPPKLSETDEFHLKVRGQILEGNLDLEQTLWNAPLDTCIRLDSIVSERIREHFSKIERERKNG